MHVAFEIADRALARRVVAERDVDVGIDQARESPSCRRRRSPHRRLRPRCADAVPTETMRSPSLTIVSPDANGSRQIAGNDLTEIDDRDFHGVHRRPVPDYACRRSSIRKIVARHQSSTIPVAPAQSKVR